MDNSTPFFSALVRFHEWFDPLAKPWAKWTYLGWMFAAIAFFNLGLWSAALSNGTSGALLALSGLGMLFLWFGTRYYWLYHTEILSKRAGKISGHSPRVCATGVLPAAKRAWSRYRRSGR